MCACVVVLVMAWQSSNRSNNVIRTLQANENCVLAACDVCAQSSNINNIINNFNNNNHLYMSLLSSTSNDHVVLSHHKRSLISSIASKDQLSTWSFRVLFQHRATRWRRFRGASNAQTQDQTKAQTKPKHKPKHKHKKASGSAAKSKRKPKRSKSESSDTDEY